SLPTRRSSDLVVAGGRWPVALILGQGDVLAVAFPGFTVGHDLDAWQLNDFIIEAAGFLGCCSAPLGFQCEIVLLIASDVVAFGNDLGGLQHRHVDIWLVFDQPRVSGPVSVLVLILHQRNRLNPATERKRTRLVY